MLPCESSQRQQRSCAEGRRCIGLKNTWQKRNSRCERLDKIHVIWIGLEIFQHRSCCLQKVLPSFSEIRIWKITVPDMKIHIFEVYCAWAFYKQLTAHGVGESNLFSFILEIEHSGGQVSLHLKHEAVQLLSVRFWLDMFSVYYKEIQYLRAKADLLVEELKILSRVQSLNYGVTSQVVKILMCM